MGTLITRYVTYPKDGLWVAHSLELDVTGVAEKEAAAIRELKFNAEAHLAASLRRGVSPYRPAPIHVQQLWAESRGVGMACEIREHGPIPASKERQPVERVARKEVLLRPRSRTRSMNW